MKRPPSILLRARQAGDRRALARRSARLEAGQTYGFSMISPVLSGVVVTPQTALTLTSYYAGVNVISGDVAKLPFLTYRRTRQGGKDPDRKHRNHRLLAVQPNPEMNAVRFWQAMMGHVLGWGGGLAEIVRKGGEAAELWPMNPATVKPHRTPETKALYYQDEATGRKWRPENVLHVAGLGFDGISGYSPATMARQAIGLGIGAEQFGASLFGNGAIPRGILKHPKRLSEVAAKNLRESFERVHGGSQNANRTAILEEGADWINTQINPDDAQFLATRQFQVLEIARLLNLPPHKLGDYSQAHLANVEESNRDYLESCLQYWLEVIAAECNAKLFFDDERDKLFCQHDTSALLKGNTQARGEFYKTLKGLGAINADTIASMEGLPVPGPENGGDKYLVQMQDVPAEQAGADLSEPAPAKKDGPDELRFNPHHGKDGKFTSKGGHGIAIGGKFAKKDDEPPAIDLAGAAPKDVRAHHDAMSADWRDSISTGPFKDRLDGAVSGYTTSIYEPINTKLRSGKVVGGYEPKSLDAIGAKLDKALDRASLKERTVVYRGVRDVKALGLDPDRLVGSTIHDKGYLSTSLTPKIAEGFATKAKGGAVLKITAPKGAKGASVAGLTNKKGEFEVLFHRDAKLKITHQARDDKGRLTLHAELSH